MKERIVANDEIAAIDIVVPEGHKHLRTTIRLKSGESLVFQEATVANLARAFVAIKTDPVRRSVRLVGRRLGDEELKEGFASWQLLEEKG